MTGRRAGLVLAALAGGVTAYGLYRLGARFRPGDPVAGLGDFTDAVRAGMAQRERDLREALGYEAAANAPQRGASKAAASFGYDRAAGLTPEQARDLLRDPAGPRPERLDPERVDPDRVDGDEGAGI